MEMAIEEAYKAYSLGEVPVGAVIVKEGKVIGRGHNRKETSGDPTAHAEMIAIREAAKHVGGWRILESTMYVTLEPCPMCAGAIVMARIPRLVAGVKDPRTGACGSLWNIVDDHRLNHRVEVTFGIMEDECRNLLEMFFRELREEKFDL
ncbi:MAG TPA: tRNA adenosine(34) deaminase TadA [Bacillota bacterium]|nr:nucleoside deaminase [Candidatus Fermentithermobacillaceae bacterium]HOB30737.1 tRNA adenosine(34) deaminase TadA [Bacillota bacterium]HOK64858.1 tRNA adenosine(34) deaminase TadA [Bacillota bacterium]HOL12599.1 tRNA adenosine(34) deaminase TadA [Bacillota bacterium]HOQ03321.1 tRNA adenosine(34) deaminase TadA [Bacillota bacterium]